MKVIGIIAEYNPFHKGHLYHLNESKRISGANVSVAVMSGNFTQRGEAALLSKWERAKIAVDCGVDLVIELPFIFACNTAEYFAHGATRILNELSCVDVISFGSESGDMDKLSEAAKSVSRETPEFKKIMRENLKKGVSFPKARGEAVRQTVGVGSAEMLSRPNNILAAEYIRQLTSMNSGIELMTIKRKGQDYGSKILAGEFSSAAAIRSCLEEKKDIDAIREFVPAACFSDIKTFNIDINKMINSMFLLMAAKILTESAASLEKIFSVNEGLQNKIKKAMRESESLEVLIEKIKSKRYTRTRIQRLLTHLLLGLQASDFTEIMDKEMMYARVLAFSGTGARLLKKIKDGKPRIPIITNINKQVREDDDINKLLKYDIHAGDMYNLISGRGIYANSDFVVSPYHIAFPTKL